MTQHYLTWPTNETYACGAGALGRRSPTDHDPNFTTCKECKIWPNGDDPHDPNYVDPKLLEGVKLTEAPLSGRTVSGYGPKIPTRFMIRYSGLWRRVYVMQYGNSGSSYVIVKGKDTFLDTAVEARIENYSMLVLKGQVA